MSDYNEVSQIMSSNGRLTSGPVREHGESACAL